MTVILSQVSFWLNRESVPARTVFGEYGNEYGNFLYSWTRGDGMYGEYILIYTHLMSK